MNQESLLKLIKKNPMLKVSALERQAKIPTGSLKKAMSGSQDIKQEYVEKVYRVIQGLTEDSFSDTKIISIVNNKGGVGKTTTACNLGKGLELKGNKVLVIDIDPQGNLSIYLDIVNPERGEFVDLLLKATDDFDSVLYKQSENLHILPSSIRLDAATIELQKQGITGFKRIKNVLAPVLEKYDFILIDCPPSLGILTAASLVASTDVIIPLSAEPFALHGIKNIMSLIKDAREINPNLNILGFLFVAVKPNTVVHRDLMKSLKEHLSAYTVFESYINESTVFPESTGARKDIFTYSPNSRGAKDYMQVTEETLKILEYGEE